jgi:hypothetical protein
VSSEIRTINDFHIRWHNRECKLAKPLLVERDNHPGEEEAAVVSRNHHILFEPLLKCPEKE